MKQFVLIIGATVLAATVADSTNANPVSCETLRTKQVPKSTHVQLSFAETCNEDLKIVSVTRDSKSINPDWQPHKGFETNMGSGVESVTAKQICDCNVSEGAHTYAVNFQVKYDGETHDASFDTTIDVLSPETFGSVDTDSGSEASDTEDSESEEMMPWSEPEPEEVQGLDCIAACKNDGPGTEAAAETADKDAGCAVIAVAAGTLDMSPLPLLLLGLIPIILLRNKKQS